MSNVQEFVKTQTGLPRLTDDQVIATLRLIAAMSDPHDESREQLSRLVRREWRGRGRNAVFAYVEELTRVLTDENRDALRVNVFEMLDAML